MEEKEIVQEVKEVIVKEIDNSKLEELKQQLEKMKEENKLLNQEFAKFKEENNRVEVVVDKPREKNNELWKEVF